jgi:hypothetical protein
VPDLPQRIENAIHGALTVDREERIPDCETLLAVLKGHTSWELPDRPDSEHETDEMPRKLQADVPDMPVASRGPGGSTPGPSALSAPVDDETMLVEPGDSVDGTLDATDSLVNTIDDQQVGWIVILTASLVGVLGIAAVVLAVGLGLGSLVFSGPPDEMPMVPGTPEEVPAVVDPETDEDAPGEGETLEVAPEPAPEPAPMKPTPRPTPQPKPRTVTKPVPIPVPAPVDTPEPTGLVTVKILSLPPTATVWVDGQARGKTPLKLELSPGRHAVGLTSGTQTAEYMISIGAEASNKWCYDFEASLNRPGGC